MQDITEMKKVNSLRKPILLAGAFISLSLYVISLTREAYCTTAGCEASWSAALFGLFFFFATEANLVWFANPFFLAALIFSFYSPYKALLLSLVGLSIALSFLGCDKVLSGGMGGGTFEIIKYMSGYWFWVSSIGNIAIFNLLQILLDRRFSNTHM